MLKKGTTTQLTPIFSRNFSSLYMLYLWTKSEVKNYLTPEVVFSLEIGQQGFGNFEKFCRVFPLEKSFFCRCLYS
jgi:hypothetical protein